MARKYETKVTFLTSAGQDSIGNAAEALADFAWPQNIVTAFDPRGELWAHFGVTFRGTWVLINQDGKVLTRTSPHPESGRLEAEFQKLIAA
ncbi:MAG: TlpA family protein disulfide reductase [Actinomycetota bacterium]